MFMEALGFKKIHRKTGNGWKVIEMRPDEIENNQKMDGSENIPPDISILGNSASEIFFYLSEIFPYLSEGFSYDPERFYLADVKKEATDKNRLKRTNYDRRQKLREGGARHALLSHRYPQGSAQPAGEMDQPVPRAQAEPLFGLRRQVFPLLHPAMRAEIIEFLDEP